MCVWVLRDIQYNNNDIYTSNITNENYTYYKDILYIYKNNLIRENKVKEQLW